MKLLIHIQNAHVLFLTCDDLVLLANHVKLVLANKCVSTILCMVIRLFEIAIEFFLELLFNFWDFLKLVLLIAHFVQDFADKIGTGWTYLDLVFLVVLFGGWLIDDILLVLGNPLAKLWGLIVTLLLVSLGASGPIFRCFVSASISTSCLSISVAFVLLWVVKRALFINNLIKRYGLLLSHIWIELLLNVFNVWIILVDGTFHGELNMVG